VAIGKILTYDASRGPSAMAELLVYDALMLSFYFEVLRGRQREGTASD